jgi:hypothetical protein
MIGVGQDEEDVLKDAEEVLLEESVAHGRVGSCKIIDYFQTH